MMVLIETNKWQVWLEINKGQCSPVCTLTQLWSRYV